MVQERRRSLSDEDIQRIADAIVEREKEKNIGFCIDAEEHYNAHKRIDKLLDAYESATNIFVRTFLAMVIVGAIVLAGLSIFKGVK